MSIEVLIKEKISLCDEYLRLEEQLWDEKAFWHNNTKYWIEGKGMTREGFKKLRTIEKEQDGLLNKLEISRVIGEQSDKTFLIINELKKLLQKLKEMD